MAEQDCIEIKGLVKREPNFIEDNDVYYAELIIKTDDDKTVYVRYNNCVSIGTEAFLYCIGRTVKVSGYFVPDTDIFMCNNIRIDVETPRETQI